MNKKSKIFRYKYLLVILIIFIIAACEKMLDIRPEDSKVRDEFWKVKSDVEASVIGSYNSIQSCVLKFFVWGELRGELIGWSKDNGGLRSIIEQELDQTNQYCKWNEVYSAINKVNTVLRFAPDAQKNDNTFTEQELDYYKGECITLRALLYFYIARTYYEFPYITRPSENDQQKYDVPGILGTQVLDSLVSDLLLAETLVRPSYDSAYFSSMNITSEALKNAYKKGRVSKPLVWALLTDIYLTKGEYDKAIMYADKIISERSYSLVNSNSWITNFYPGNSTESIFELQFSRTYFNSGDMAKWFVSSLSNDILFINQRNEFTKTYKYWEGDDPVNLKKNDPRGPNGTFNGTSKTVIWKWAGKGSTGAQTEYRDISSDDCHWIFYRLADIYLMKAEALNRIQQPENAIETLNIVRKRAKQNELIEFASENLLEERILDERARELAAEGKRWFDLVRIAKRQNNYEIIGSRIAEARARTVSEQNAWKAKVFKPLSWYYPIHENELQLNKMLKQNPYYAETK